MFDEKIETTQGDSWYANWLTQRNGKDAFNIDARSSRKISSINVMEINFIASHGRTLSKDFSFY